MPKTVILGAARTPFGKMGGSLAGVDPTDLGGTAIAAALERADVAPEQVQHVSFGQVLQAGQGQIPSRQAQIKAGIPKEVSSETINKVCASSIRAVSLIDTAVRAGDLEVAVGGGMESMSRAPYLLPGARSGFRMGDVKALDAMTHDGLTNPFTNKMMSVEASEVGEELEMTRADLDKFAVRSHQLAAKATEEGKLGEEIVGVEVKVKKEMKTVAEDEAIRPDTSLETLAKLPGLSEHGTHTAGNSPGVNDGAAALVLASDEWAKANSRSVLATIVAHAQVADDFPYLARTPANAAKAALEKAGLSRRRHRPLRDQRGVRLRRAELHADARRRRGQGECQRRRDRPRPPDRRERRAHPHGAGERAAPARRRARCRGDLLRRWPGRRGDPGGQRGVGRARAAGGAGLVPHVGRLATRKRGLGRRGDLLARCRSSVIEVRVCRPIAA